MADMCAHEVIDKVHPRQRCCGSTNPRCDEKHPWITATGCDRCGHSLGCHARP